MVMIMHRCVLLLVVFFVFYLFVIGGVGYVYICVVWFSIGGGYIFNLCD